MLKKRVSTSGSVMYTGAIGFVLILLSVILENLFQYGAYQLSIEQTAGVLGFIFGSILIYPLIFLIQLITAYKTPRRGLSLAVIWLIFSFLRTAKGISSLLTLYGSSNSEMDPILYRYYLISLSLFILGSTLTAISCILVLKRLHRTTPSLNQVSGLTPELGSDSTPSKLLMSAVVMPGTITGMSGALTGATFPIRAKGVIFIGRDTKFSNVTIGNVSETIVDRRHCSVEYKESNEYVVTDLSYKGTFYKDNNGNLVPLGKNIPLVFQPGAIIFIGDTSNSFRLN